MLPVDFTVYSMATHTSQEIDIHKSIYLEHKLNVLQGYFVVVITDISDIILVIEPIGRSMATCPAIVAKGPRNGDPMHEGCILRNKGEARGKSRHQNNSKREVKNLEQRNVGTKMYSQTRSN